MEKASMCFIISAVLVFTACGHSYTHHPLIVEAESLVCALPDSALSLLQSIEEPQQLNTADYAAWCLQSTYATYMLRYPIVSDSLIDIAVNYYNNTDLYYYSGLAYYLKGYINEQNGNKQKAITAYKTALRELEATDSIRLRGLCYQNLGYMYMHDRLYEHALDYFRKAMETYNVNNIIYDRAYTLLQIGQLMNLLYYPEDTVVSCLDKALDLSLQLPDSSLYYYILDAKAAALLNTDKEQAKNMKLQVYSSNPETYYYTTVYLSYLYSMLNKSDSAQYFYNIAAAGGMLQNDYWTNIAAAYVEWHSGNYDPAFEHFEKAFTLYDSSYRATVDAKILHIEKQYDKAEKEKENAELKAKNREYLVWSLLLITGSLLLIIVLLLKLNDRRKRELNLLKINREKDEQYKLIKHKNEQHRQQQLAKLTTRVGNTLVYSKLNTGLRNKKRIEAFMEDVMLQSVISPDDHAYYLKEVERLSGGKFTELMKLYPQLTNSDLIVIALTYLGYGISETCLLLNVNIPTMYTRRKRIKQHGNIEEKIGFENWVTRVLGEKPEPLSERS